MAQEQIRAPSTSAGLMSFYDVTSSKVQVDAKAVIGLCAAVIVLELILQVLFK